MKPFLALAAAALLGAASFAVAAPSHQRSWSPPSPFTPFTPPKPLPAPLPIPVPRPSPVVNPTVATLLKVAAGADAIVADLQAADVVAAAINPRTDKPWDALGHLCFPAAIAFIERLPGASSPPAPGAGAGLIAAFETARINLLGVRQAINQIVSVGYPNSLKIACDPWIADNVQQTINGDAMITGFLAGLVPK